MISDIPASLPEAEKLLSQHQTIKEEIDNYKDEYAKMMEYGEKITAVSVIYLWYILFHRYVTLKFLRIYFENFSM